MLLMLSLFCLAMITVTTVRDEWLSPLRTAVGYFLTPVQAGVNRVGRALYSDVKEREKLKTALADNQLLQAKIDALTIENTRLQSNQFELRRLRSLYGLNQQYGRYRMTGARVIAKDTGGWFHIFRIDKGSADGIRVDMNVMAGGGLAGIVTDVGANYATVRSIIDDVSRVSAMALRSGDTCIVSGDLKMYAEGKLLLSDITDTADIRDGDKIVTGAVSSKFLPGILIGYAQDLKTDPTRLTRSGTLVPVADFGTLQEVLIILDLKSEMKESGGAAEEFFPEGTEDQSAAPQGIVPVLEESSELPPEATEAAEETAAESAGETRGETAAAATETKPRETAARETEPRTQPRETAARETEPRTQPAETAAAEGADAGSAGETQGETAAAAAETDPVTIVESLPAPEEQ